MSIDLNTYKPSFGNTVISGNTFRRINNPKRYQQAGEYLEKLDQLPILTVIDFDKNGRLSGKVVVKGEEKIAMLENSARAFFNLSPVKFLKRLYTEAKIISKKQ